MFNEIEMHILRRMEAFPDVSFSESELSSISKTLFDQMVDADQLSFRRRDNHGDPYVSSGDPFDRFLRIRGSKVEAVAYDGDADTLTLTEPDIIYYALNMGSFAKSIKDANTLSGEIDLKISSRLVFIGTIFATKTAVLIGFFDDDDTARDELLTLWSKMVGYFLAKFF